MRIRTADDDESSILPGEHWLLKSSSSPDLRLKRRKLQMDPDDPGVGDDRAHDDTHSSYQERDASWIQFNERVLAEALNSENPLLERLRFLAITASNLDEYFMHRYARNPAESRLALLASIRLFLDRQQCVYWLLRERLGRHRIHLPVQRNRSPAAFASGRSVFLEEILPQITAFRPCALEDLEKMRHHDRILGLSDGRVLPVPRDLSAIFIRETRDGTQVHFLDQLLLEHLEVDGLRARYVARLIRDGDFSMDFRRRRKPGSRNPEKAIVKGLADRERGAPVLLEILGEAGNTERLRWQLRLGLLADEILMVPVSLELRSLEALASLNPVLRYPAMEERIHDVFRDFQISDPDPVFRYLDHEDILLHHPYDSFESVVRLVRAARMDPRVTRIEQTLYRVDSRSELLRELKLAAREKQVRVVIELRARMDELKNLAIAEELRQAGVEVHFGFGSWKLHAKVLLITRETVDGQRRYVHLSTGNYNAETARFYTDLSLITSDAGIGNDVRRFMDAVSEEQVPWGMQDILISPDRMHRELVRLIDAETEAALRGEEGASIVIKVNGLIDEDLIRRLYRASGAGVNVDLIVRGVCTLRPGIRDLSERIRVFSVVDRYLEHSRIYHFGWSRRLYLSSADWMPRNFRSRLEIAFPLKRPEVVKRVLESVIPGYLNDHSRSWQLKEDGEWMRRRKEEGKENLIRAQCHFHGCHPDFSKGSTADRGYH